jgi:similar to stage IV sporulation protein
MDVAKQLFLVSFRMEGLSLERLLNLAGEQNIMLHDLTRNGLKAVEGVCVESDYAKLAELAEKRGWKLTRLKHKRLSAVRNWLKKRLAVAVGLVICLTLAIVSMQFIWRIDILDAGPYESEVRLYLKEQNIHPGIWKRDISLQTLTSGLEWRMPKVAWVQSYYRGAALVIRCVLGVPPPGVETQGGPGDVVAQRDGILVTLLPLAGTPVCKPGDMVRAGQVLISGWERGTGKEKIPVKARGIAMARGWVGAKVRIPLDEVHSEPTGRTYVSQAIQTPYFQVGTLETPEFLQYDRTVEQWPIGGVWWPVYLRRETFEEVALTVVPRDDAEVKAEAGLAALRELSQKLGAGHEPVDKWVDYCMIEGRMLEATAIAEILADIALPKPWEAGAAP